MEENMIIEETIEENLEKAEFCFKQSCEQIVFLNKKLFELKSRYNKAQNENHKSFRYSIRLKIAVAEGIRNAYYEYACGKADKVNQLREEMLNSSPGSDDDADVNNDMDDDERIVIEEVENDN